MIGTLVECTTHTAHQVDDVAIELHVLIEIHLHAMAVAAQVIASQIDQHHVLGILLRVVAQELCCLAVLFHITRTLGCSCDRVDKRLVAHNAVVSLRRRTEDAETSEVEIEEIRTWVDASQSTIELEVIALILLHEAAAHHNLEDIATQAVLDAATDVRLVLLIGQGRSGSAYWVEIVWLHIRLVDCLQQIVYFK